MNIYYLQIAKMNMFLRLKRTLMTPVMKILTYLRMRTVLSTSRRNLSVQRRSVEGRERFPLDSMEILHLKYPTK
jgi:hypothetical protein